MYDTACDDRRCGRRNRAEDILYRSSHGPRPSRALPRDRLARRTAQFEKPGPDKSPPDPNRKQDLDAAVSRDIYASRCKTGGDNRKSLPARPPRKQIQDPTSRSHRRRSMPARWAKSCRANAVSRPRDRLRYPRTRVGPGLGLNYWMSSQNSSACRSVDRTS